MIFPHLYNIIIDVTVSVPATITIHEGDGIVQVCATLCAVENTERDFTITLATSDGTGTEKQKAKFSRNFTEKSIFLKLWIVWTTLVLYLLKSSHLHLPIIQLDV